MTFSPHHAYDCMVVAFNEGRWWLAYQLSHTLLGQVRKPGSGAARWWELKKWIIVQEIALQSKKQLTREEQGQ